MTLITGSGYVYFVCICSLRDLMNSIITPTLCIREMTSFRWIAIVGCCCFLLLLGLGSRREMALSVDLQTKRFSNSPLPCGPLAMVTAFILSHCCVLFASPSISNWHLFSRKIIHVPQVTPFGRSKLSWWSLAPFVSFRECNHSKVFVIIQGGEIDFLASDWPMSRLWKGDSRFMVVSCVYIIICIYNDIYRVCITLDLTTLVGYVCSGTLPKWWQ
jgi:hypothetical protein